jgi:fluoride exporter
MSAALLAGVAVAGALGAVCRFLLDGAVAVRVGQPWGTAAVNVSGSLAAGAVAGLALRGLDPSAQVVVATGFLGAFTTFSTWMVQTVVLLEQRQHARAAGSVLTLAVGALAAAAGYALAR